MAKSDFVRLILSPIIFARFKKTENCHVDDDYDSLEGRITVMMRKNTVRERQESIKEFQALAVAVALAGGADMVGP